MPFSKASLELCWACGEVIKDHVIRGLERAYHPSCFVCTTCRQPIGEQRFAQGEVGEVYCLQDYYRYTSHRKRVTTLLQVWILKVVENGMNSKYYTVSAYVLRYFLSEKCLTLMQHLSETCRSGVDLTITSLFLNTAGSMPHSVVPVNCWSFRERTAQTASQWSVLDVPSMKIATVVR